MPGGTAPVHSLKDPSWNLTQCVACSGLPKSEVREGGGGGAGASLQALACSSCVPVDSISAACYFTSREILPMRLIMRLQGNF